MANWTANGGEWRTERGAQTLVVVWSFPIYAWSIQHGDRIVAEGVKTSLEEAQRAATRLSKRSAGW